MKIRYTYTVYKDYPEATKISQSRSLTALFLAILHTSTTMVSLSLILADLKSNWRGIFLLLASIGSIVYLFTYYPIVTNRRIRKAIEEHIRIQNYLKYSTYTCKSIKLTKDSSPGLCCVCHIRSQKLTICEIKQDNETRIIPICNSCISKFKENLTSTQNTSYQKSKSAPASATISNSSISVSESSASTVNPSSTSSSQQYTSSSQSTDDVSNPAYNISHMMWSGAFAYGRLIDPSISISHKAIIWTAAYYCVAKTLKNTYANSKIFANFSKPLSNYIPSAEMEVCVATANSAHSSFIKILNEHHLDPTLPDDLTVLWHLVKIQIYGQVEPPDGSNAFFHKIIHRCVNLALSRSTELIQENFPN